jgi:hypothetical protein
LVQPASCGNPAATRLYDDLLSNYNKIVRPVVNNSDVLKVRIKLKLSQLIDLASVFSSYFGCLGVFSYSVKEGGKKNPTLVVTLLESSALYFP